MFRNLSDQKFYPDTCSCICDNIDRIVLRKCSIHNSFSDVENHNRNLNYAFVDSDPVEKQIEDIRLAKLTYYEKNIDDPTILSRLKRFLGL